MGIPTIICGYRDDDGVVHSLEKMETLKIPQRAKANTYLYPMQRVGEGIIFLTHQSVGQSISQSISPVFLVSATPLKRSTEFCETLYL